MCAFKQLFGPSVSSNKPSNLARKKTKEAKISHSSPANTLHVISTPPSSFCFGIGGGLFSRKERHSAQRHKTFQFSIPVCRRTFMSWSRPCLLMRTVSTGGFINFKISGFNVCTTKNLVMVEEILTSNERFQFLVKIAHNFLVSRE